MGKLVAEMTEEQRARKRAAERERYSKNRETALAKKAAYSAANRDKLRDRNAAYRAANREARAAGSRAYYAANSEARREYNAAYYAANREALREKQAAYRAAHPEKKRENDARYKRELLAATSETIPYLATEADRLEATGNVERCREFAETITYQQAWVSERLEEFVVKYLEELE